jgi:hydrogenase 3 maturation protease
MLDEIKPLPDLLLIKAETNPENFIQPIKKFRPQKIIFLDALDFGGRPGDVKVFRPANIQDFTAATHRMPILLFCKLFKETEIAVIGIQPATISHSISLSKKLRLEFNQIVKKVNLAIWNFKFSKSKYPATF